MEKLPYDQIEVLVYAYQDGDKDAIYTLLLHYEGYFIKFLDVLKSKYTVVGMQGKSVVRHAKFDIDNSIQRRFVAAFMRTAGDRRVVRMYRRSVPVRNKIYKTLNRIREQFLRYNAEDLLQEMRIIFMEMAIRHKGSKFYNYVSTTFPKMLLKRLLQIRDPFTYESYDDENAWNYGHYAWDKYQVDPPKVKYRVIDSEDTDFDANWINGDCGELFEHLTPFERRLLKLYYEVDTIYPSDFDSRAAYMARRKELRHSDCDIAIRFGYSRKTINNKRNHAVASVRERALEHGLIKE